LGGNYEVKVQNRTEAGMAAKGKYLLLLHWRSRRERRDKNTRYLSANTRMS